MKINDMIKLAQEKLARLQALETESLNDLDRLAKSTGEKLVDWSRVRRIQELRRQYNHLTGEISMMIEHEYTQADFLRVETSRGQIYYMPEWELEAFKEIEGEEVFSADIVRRVPQLCHLWTSGRAEEESKLEILNVYEEYLKKADFSAENEDYGDAEDSLAYAQKIMGVMSALRDGVACWVVSKSNNSDDLSKNAPYTRFLKYIKNGDQFTFQSLPF